jgi:hypothetical protein
VGGALELPSPANCQERPGGASAESGWRWELGPRAKAVQIAGSGELPHCWLASPRRSRLLRGAARPGSRRHEGRPRGPATGDCSGPASRKARKPAPPPSSDRTTRHVDTRAAPTAPTTQPKPHPLLPRPCPSSRRRSAAWAPAAGAPSSPPGGWSRVRGQRCRTGATPQARPGLLRRALVTARPKTPPLTLPLPIARSARLCPAPGCLRQQLRRGDGRHQPGGRAGVLRGCQAAPPGQWWAWHDRDFALLRLLAAAKTLPSFNRCTTRSRKRRADPAVPAASPRQGICLARPNACRVPRTPATPRAQPLAPCCCRSQPLREGLRRQHHRPGGRAAAAAQRRRELHGGISPQRPQRCCTSGRAVYLRRLVDPERRGATTPVIVAARLRTLPTPLCTYPRRPTLCRTRRWTCASASTPARAWPPRRWRAR